MNDTYEQTLQIWDKLFKTKTITRDEIQLIEEKMDKVREALKFFEPIIIDDDMPHAMIDICDDVDDEDDGKEKFYVHVGNEYFNFHIVD